MITGKYGDFWSKVEKTAGCWFWKGACSPSGYGRAKVEDRAWLVHRYVYTTMVGEIPAGLEVCHKCNTRNCVNPDHLYLGTHRRNMDDVVVARSSKGVCYACGQKVS